MSYREFLAEFEKLDLANDRALIEWLMRVFAFAHESKTVPPSDNMIAQSVGLARELLPNDALPNEPPTYETGNPKLAEWLIQRAINLTYASMEQGLFDIEAWHFAELARDYLGRG